MAAYDSLPKKAQSKYLKFSVNYCKKPEKDFKKGQSMLVHTKACFTIVAIGTSICNSYYLDNPLAILLAQTETINILLKLNNFVGKPDQFLTLIEYYTERICEGIPPRTAYYEAKTEAHNNTRIYQDDSNKKIFKNNKGKIFKNNNKNNNKSKSNIPVRHIDNNMIGSSPHLCHGPLCTVQGCQNKNKS